MRRAIIAAAVLIFVSAGFGLVSQRGQGEEQGATNLGQNVNGPDSDFGPIITADGNALYYTSDREGGFGGQDVWVSRRQGGQWGPPANLGDQINTEFNEGPDTFSVDEKIMFFTRCDKIGQPGTCDIYTASWDVANQRWIGVRNLGPNVNSRFNDANTTLSYDGQTIYFVSDRPEQDGRRRHWDIFTSHRKGDDWTPAERLGAPVNTPGNEFHVIIHQDGQSLYYSSDGHGGFGGADIFRSKIEGGKYGPPENLGPLINTPENDMYFTLPASGELAYLASNRAGGFGEEDIYSVPIPFLVMPQGVIIVQGIVADVDTCAPPTVDPVTGASVYDIKTCTPIDQAVVRLQEAVTEQVIKDTVTGPDGFYKVSIPSGHDYMITATATDYTFHSERFNVAQNQPYQVIERNILLKRAEVGRAFVVNNIYFDFDKATLRPESIVQLNIAADWLRQSPDRRIEVGGHTDSKGSDEYNIRLSQRRAQSVVDYLVSVGIDPSRLAAHGYGERMPIASNATDEGRQLNRRVEFKIIQ